MSTLESSLFYTTKSFIQRKLVCVLHSIARSVGSFVLVIFIVVVMIIFYYYWQPRIKKTTKPKLNCVSAVKYVCEKLLIWVGFCLILFKPFTMHKPYTNDQFNSRFYCVRISFALLLAYLLSFIRLFGCYFQFVIVSFVLSVFFSLPFLFFFFFFQTIICTCCVYIGKSIEFH